MPLPAHYATTPCRICGQPIIFVTAAGGDRVALDPRPAIFARQADGEGGAVWAKCTSGEILATHSMVCGTKWSPAQAGGRSS